MKSGKKVNVTRSSVNVSVEEYEIIPKDNELLYNARMYLEKFKDYNKAYSLYSKAKKTMPFEAEVYKGYFYQ